MSELVTGYSSCEVEDGQLYLYVGEQDNSTLRVRLSWPEANRLQAEVRQSCVNAGITLRGM